MNRLFIIGGNLAILCWACLAGCHNSATSANPNASSRINPAMFEQQAADWLQVKDGEYPAIRLATVRWLDEDEVAVDLLIRATVSEIERYSWDVLGLLLSEHASLLQVVREDRIVAEHNSFRWARPKSGRYTQVDPRPQVHIVGVAANDSVAVLSTHWIFEGSPVTSIALQPVDTLEINGVLFHVK